MAKLKIKTQDGATLEIEGHRFSHYIANCRFWFFLHKQIGGNCLTVTHWDSGKKVCLVPNNSIAACVGDAKSAAKMELDSMAKRVGAERMRSVLIGAEK